MPIAVAALGVMALDYITGMIKATYPRAESHSSSVLEILKSFAYVVMVAQSVRRWLLLARCRSSGPGITLDVKLF
ncbi:phage holin family protein [Hominenteromicrobium sp.]|uniref:phage holin family protein n=1 Tax=Hominenteromicrobium sp. TaxID=3073581 RepID=UPI00399B2BC1